MIATLPIHFSTFEQMSFSQGATTRLLMACAMGGLIGVEREWRHKASGLRTNLLLCMGCALFTVLSGVLAGPGITDKSRVASNIVQGIGFLGAGLILHTRNRVLGLTSAATVFVVASIGMACGAGLLDCWRHGRDGSGSRCCTRCAETTRRQCSRRFWRCWTASICG